MHIVFLSVNFRHPDSDQKRGGGEISNRLLLESLAGSHRVTIVSATGSGLWGATVRGVTYYDLSVAPGGRLVGRSAVVFAKLFFTTLVPFMLAWLRPSVILVSTLEHSAAFRYRRWTGVPVGGFLRAYENFRLFPWLSWQGVKLWMRRLLYGNFLRGGVKRLDFVMPNSDFFAQVCSREFPGPRQYIIYPPIDAGDGSKRDSEYSIQRVAMVSNAPHKGFRVFFELARRFPGIEFHVIGYRLEFSIAEDKSLPNLITHEWVPDVATLMETMDMVLVPSEWEEPFGRVAVEALQVGSCVLVSDSGGLPEAVGHMSALIVSGSEVSVWEQRLRSIMADSTEFLEQSCRARRAAQQFRLCHQSARLEEVLVHELEGRGEAVV